MDLLYPARQVKHQAFVARKRALSRYEAWKLRFDDARWARAEERRPYRYDPHRYPHTFIARPSPTAANDLPVPRIIYSCWLGGEMSGTRARSLEILRSLDHEAQIVHITPENLNDVMLKEHPFHPAYRFLSPVHQSDYLRVYLMHFHGGGYTDLKAPRHGWGPAFERLDRDPHRWVLGYREITSNYTPELPRATGRDLNRHYRAVLGPSAFIFRPQTSFTAEWWREVNRRMDYYRDALEETPGSEDSYHPQPGYPIRWTELTGDPLHQLCLKYQDRLIFEPSVRPTLRHYR